MFARCGTRLSAEIMDKRRFYIGQSRESHKAEKTIDIFFLGGWEVRMSCLELLRSQLPQSEIDSHPPIYTGFFRH